MTYGTQYCQRPGCVDWYDFDTARGWNAPNPDDRDDLLCQSCLDAGWRWGRCHGTGYLLAGECESCRAAEAEACYGDAVYDLLAGIAGYLGSVGVG